MILETAQLLSTAHHLYPLPNFDLSEIYKPTHKNHPCAIWVRSSRENYRWTYALFRELLTEYTFRYDRIHASSRLLEVLNIIPNLPYGPFTDPPQAMPAEYQDEDTVEAYQRYYRLGKSHLLTYTRRKRPSFLTPFYLPIAG